VFIVSIAIFLAVILFAGSASSLAMAQQQTTTTATPLLPPPSVTTGQATSSLPATPPLTPQEQEQLNRLQNVIAATNQNLDETEKQIGGIVYTPRWSDPVWVEPDSAAVLVAYCLPGEFAESGQEILGGGFELEVLESYEVALPQNFTAWMMVIGNEDRQNRYPAAVGVICASDANNAERRVVSPQEQQQINNVVQQITQVTSIDQVINIINNNNNATNQNTTGGGGAPPPPPPPPAGTDTIAPSLSVPVTRVIPTTSPTGEELVLYDVSVTDNVDGTARLDANNMLRQEDNFAGSVTISCNPPSNTNFRIGNYTIQCSATDAAGNTATASFIVAVTSATTTPSVSQSSPAATLQAENTTTTITTTDDAGAGGTGGGGSGGSDEDDDDGGGGDGTDDTESPPPPATTNDDDEGAGGAGGTGGTSDNGGTTTTDGAGGTGGGTGPEPPSE
jgi:HYR domain